MGAVEGVSGHFAWCISTSAAIAAHVLLLWTVAPAPRAETISASTAIHWQTLAPIGAPAAEDVWPPSAATPAGTPGYDNRSTPSGKRGASIANSRPAAKRPTAAAYRSATASKEPAAESGAGQRDDPSRAIARGDAAEHAESTPRAAVSGDAATMTTVTGKQS